jgi:hypothetical protein
MSGNQQDEQGRINISIPKGVHTKARLYCVEHGITMSELIVEALTKFLVSAPPKKKPTA